MYRNIKNFLMKIFKPSDNWFIEGNIAYLSSEYAEKDRERYLRYELEKYNDNIIDKDIFDNNTIGLKESYKRDLEIVDKYKNGEDISSFVIKRQLNKSWFSYKKYKEFIVERELLKKQRGKLCK